MSSDKQIFEKASAIPALPPFGKIALYIDSSGLLAGIDYQGNAVNLFATTIKQAYNQSSSPTVASDTTQGYAAGSRWYQTDGSEYFCTSASTGAAVWKKVAGVNINGHTVIGNNPSATGTSVGGGTANGASNGVAVGLNSNGSYNGAAVGESANANSSGAALGYNANGQNGVAIGYNSVGTGGNVAVGQNAAASGSAVVVGASATGSGTCVAVGYDAHCTSGNGIAIGYQTHSVTGGMAIGASSIANDGCIAIGIAANSSGYSQSIAIGNNATVDNNNAVAIGQGGTANDGWLHYMGYGLMDDSGNVVALINGNNIAYGSASVDFNDGTFNSSGDVTLGNSGFAQIVINQDSSGVSNVTLPISGTLAYRITSVAFLNFPNTTAGSSSDLTMTLTGAVVGDAVILGVPNGSTSTNGVFTAWVSASDTIKVRFTNTNLATAIHPPNGTFRATIAK